MINKNHKSKIARERRSKIDANKQENPFGLWRHCLKTLVDSQSSIYETSTYKTDISIGLVSVCLYHLERNMRWSGLELSSRHYCWTDMKNRDPASISDIVSYQISHSLVSFAQDNVIRLSDPSPTRLLNCIKDLSQISKKSRCIFIYNGHGSPEPISLNGIMLSPDESLSGDLITGSQLIKTMPIPSCFIFDADYSGLLYKDFSDSSLDADRFAFFSCGPEECLPHRIGLPSDLFTSCLLTPAFISMLWGSRQFYAFTSGGLHEFPLSYFSDENGVRPHLVSFTYEIERLLNCLTKAMAYSSLPTEMMYECFYRDLKVGKLFVNFCLSRRIGAEIGFKPMCYPSIPDFSQHPLWEFFDLYLDRVLLRLTQMDASISVSQGQITGDFTSFLSDALIAIEHALNLRIFESIPNEISLLPLILSEHSLNLRGINAVNRFIDTGDSALRASLCFGLMPIIISMPFSTDNQLLLPVAYAIAKMLCFSIKSDDILRNFTCSVKNLFLPLFSASQITGNNLYVTLALIIMTAGLQLDHNDQSHELPPELFSALINIIGSNFNISIFWALLYLSQFLDMLPNPAQETESYGLLDQLENIQDILNCEIKAAIISVYTSLLDFEENSIDFIYDIFSLILLNFENEPAPIVRMQLLLATQKFIDAPNNIAFNPEWKDVLDLTSQYIYKFSLDPHPEVCDVASSLLDVLGSNKRHQPPAISTTLLSGSFDAFLDAQYSQLSEFISPPFNLKPINIYVNNNLSFHNNREIIEYKFMELDHVQHFKSINTNIVFFGGERLLYGDSDGNLIIRNYSDHSIELDHPWERFFSRSIKKTSFYNILPLSDSSLLLSTINGSIAITNNILSNSPRLVDCFYISNNNNLPIFDYSFSQRTLYSSKSIGSLSTWNMDICSNLPEKKILNDSINLIKVIQSDPELIAIGSNTIHFFDHRNDSLNIHLNFINSIPLNISMIKTNNNQIISSHEDNSIYISDLRNLNEPIIKWKQNGVKYVDSCNCGSIVVTAGKSLIIRDFIKNKSYPIIDSMYPLLKNSEIQAVTFHNSKPGIGFILQESSLHVVGIGAES